jgi:hypothetical protein
MAQYEADSFNLFSNIMFYSYTRPDIGVVSEAVNCSDRFKQFEKKLNRHEDLF